MPLAAAGCAGVAAWCSVGALAIGSSGTRLGLLPPWWWLPVLVLAASAVAWKTRLSGRTAAPLFFSLILVLPWLPLPVPTAALTWTGPVTWLVWLAIVVGMLTTCRIQPRRRWGVDPQRAPRLAAAIACILYMTSGWWLAELIPAGDEPHYLVITQSLLLDHDLQIENNHARRDYRAYYPRDLRPDYLRRGTNGQIYSIHSPGLSAVVAPAFAVGGYPGVVVFLSVVAGIGTGLLWRACYILTGRESAAWFGWATGALTVPFFFQSFVVYPDGLGATLILFAAMPLIEGRVGQVGQGGPGGGRWLAIGAALALLPWLHTRFAIVTAVLGLCLLLHLMETPRWRWQALVLLSIPAASTVAWFAFFRVIYGRFSLAAPYGGFTQSEPANILRSLPAFLFDQQFGIIPNAPIYGFCLVGMFALLGRRTRLAVELSVTAGSYLLATATFYMWWAGSTTAARFMVPVLFLLVLPGAWFWQHARFLATRGIGLAALVVSLAVTAGLARVQSGRLAFNSRDGFSLGLEWLSPLVDLPRAMPSFFRQTPAGALLRALPWLLAVFGAWLVLRLIERRSVRTEASASLALATPVCLAIASMFALTAVWKLDHVAAATVESSQLDLLGHFNPRIRPLGVTLSPVDFKSAGALLPTLRISTPSRRPPPSDQTLLIAPAIVPAGQYRVRLPDGISGAGTATLVIGRMVRPWLSWDLSGGLPSGSADFDLPVDVGSIVIKGDPAAERAVHRLELQPLEVFSGRMAGGFAHRAERYGPGVAFFVDDDAFVEPTGFWIKGGGRAQIVTMPADRRGVLQLFVRNAPIANRVTIEMDGREEAIELQPREERLIPVSRVSGGPATLIRFRSDRGFRPSLVEPGSTDTRFLGCWIELR